MEIFKDFEALAALAGLIVATVVAIYSAATEKSTTESSHRKRPILIILACLGFVIGSIAVWLQHKSYEQKVREWDEASHRLERTEKTATAATVYLADLAKLTEVSPEARYHVRLSTDKDKKLPCDRMLAIDAKFPGAIKTGSVRVVKRKGWAEPFCLLFGKDLKLAAAYAFEGLAITHQLGNAQNGGVLPIEIEKQEEPADCSTTSQNTASDTRTRR